MSSNFLLFLEAKGEYVEEPIVVEAEPEVFIDLVCKATDISYNNQPDTLAGTWNFGVILWQN